MKPHIAVVLLVLLAVPLSLQAGNKKKPVEHFSALTFVVLKDSSGKPIKNASVIVHGLKPDGTQTEDGFQLKTDTDGRTHIEDIPYGKYRIQVIAHGTQTYGEDVEVNQPQHEFTVRMKPPVGQVSVY